MYFPISRAAHTTTSRSSRLLVHAQPPRASPRRPLHGSPARMFNEWSYLEKNSDEHKPPLPYQVGATLPAQAWDPALLGTGQQRPRRGWARGQLGEDLQNEHPLETCLRHTAVAAAIPDSQRVEFAVTGKIRVRDGRHSQVAKVRLRDRRPREERRRRPLPSGTALTAKFYDPLYLDIEDEHPDIFANTSHSFWHEAGIYERLRPLWGTFVPRFYGSFRVQVPVPGRLGCSRHVYAILYEYLPGIALNRVQADRWSQAERMAIMKAIVDADSWIRECGVFHDDLWPRNVILAGRPGRPFSVRLIDFDWAFTYFEPNPDAELEPEPPLDTVKRWSDRRRSPECVFEDFIDWEWTVWLQEVYLGSRG